MLATASAQVCVPLGHSSLYFYLQLLNSAVNLIVRNYEDWSTFAEVAVQIKLCPHTFLRHGVVETFSRVHHAKIFVTLHYVRSYRGTTANSDARCSVRSVLA